MARYILLSLSSCNCHIIKLFGISLPLSNYDVCRQKFSLLGDRFWSNLPSALLSRYSWRPVACCWQSDVLWRELLGQKKSAEMKRKKKKNSLALHSLWLICKELTYRLQSLCLAKKRSNCHAIKATKMEHWIVWTCSKTSWYLGTKQ